MLGTMLQKFLHRPLYEVDGFTWAEVKPPTVSRILGVSRSPVFTAKLHARSSEQFVGHIPWVCRGCHGESLEGRAEADKIISNDLSEKKVCTRIFTYGGFWAITNVSHGVRTFSHVRLGPRQAECWWMLPRGCP